MGLHAVRGPRAGIAVHRGGEALALHVEEAGTVVNQQENYSGGEQQSEQRHTPKMSAPVSLLLRCYGCIGGSRQDLSLQGRKLGAEKADHPVYQTEHLYSQSERVAPLLEFE
jgi:hypothetical protein